MNKKSIFISVIAALIVGFGVVACDSSNVAKVDAHVTPVSIINFSGVSNANFKADSFAVTDGQKWDGITNNHACEFDVLTDESSNMSSESQEICSAIKVHADLSSGSQVSDYLLGSNIQLISEASGAANVAFAGTLSFVFDDQAVSCGGIYLSQSDIGNDKVWAMYDNFGNSIAPAYTDDQTVELQCTGGGSIVVSGDDLPDDLNINNSFEIDGYTLP